MVSYGFLWFSIVMLVYQRVFIKKTRISLEYLQPPRRVKVSTTDVLALVNPKANVIGGSFYHWVDLREHLQEITDFSNEIWDFPVIIPLYCIYIYIYIIIRKSPFVLFGL